MDESQFGKGAVKDTPDTRDYQWEEVGYGAAPFDWEKGYDIEKELHVKMKPKNQNGSGSCGGQSWASYAASLEAQFSGTLEERSAKYIYAQTFEQGGGSTGRANAKIFVNQGVAREEVCPSYENGNPPSEAFMTRTGDITEAMRKDAENDKSLCYANVPNDIDSTAQAIKVNGGVILGVVGSNNGTWLSSNPKHPKVGEKFWYHWVYAGKARLKDGKKQIGLLNSWGDNVGENGWQWLDEEYFTEIVPNGNGATCIWQVWTHVYAPPAIPVYHHTFMKRLEYGMRGDEVKALQQVLLIEGDFPSNVPCTGYYGGITADAVLKFQLNYNIDTPEVLHNLKGHYVGPKTLMKLNALFGN